MDPILGMRELLTRLYGAFATGDAAYWEAAFASDALMIGTDGTEWWRGIEQLAPVLRAQMSEMQGAGITVVGHHDAVIAASGDVAWAADRPTMHLADGTELPLRLTLVAHRDGDGLMVDQLHLSVGAPNEDVVGRTLTV